ncbi:MAG: 4-hydroxy-tetrahydrodipicolinate reductase [Oscillospiraceae bacterium]|nr:4-hydroxy-tetrahydrodipicolinate reductase [Oscillospiraceae bacterium]
MPKIIISGCNGHMGRVVASLCQGDPQVEIAAGFDVLGSTDRDFPVFSSPAQFQGEADAVIDFSSPAALDGLLEFSMARKIPLVLATTGYTPEQVAQIGAAALQTPIFRSANMSLGINVLLELVKKAAAVLGDSCDIEIVERHHRRKVDAPSGTALMIADAAAGSCGHETEYVFARHSVRRPREKKEIGISAVRGGTIVGEHEIIFAGHDELIEIKHTALSREIFAQGALEAAKFMANVSAPGLYDMAQLVT